MLEKNLIFWEFLSKIKLNTYICLECKSNNDIKNLFFRWIDYFLDIQSLERELRAIGIIAISTNIDEKINQINQNKINLFQINQTSQTNINQSQKNLFKKMGLQVWFKIDIRNI